MRCGGVGYHDVNEARENSTKFSECTGLYQWILDAGTWYGITHLLRSTTLPALVMDAVDRRRHSDMLAGLRFTVQYSGLTDRKHCSTMYRVCMYYVDST